MGDKPSRNLKQRILSAVVMISVALGLLYLGSIPFALLVLTVAVLMSWEWGQIVRGAPGDEVSFVHEGSVALAVIVAALGHPLIAVSALCLGAAAMVWLRSGEASRLSAIGIFYVGLPAIVLLWMRADQSMGFEAVIFMFLVVWTTDTMAYFAGRVIGGPKLWPQISPNKTWAGFAGGVIASIIMSAIFAEFIPQASPVRLASIGLFLSVISQGGDLAESALKRGFGVKDASQLIPGHGGVMDRMDGFVTSSVAAALYAVMVNWAAPATALLIGG